MGIAEEKLPLHIVIFQTHVPKYVGETFSRTAFWKLNLDKPTFLTRFHALKKNCSSFSFNSDRHKDLLWFSTTESHESNFLEGILQHRKY